MGINLIFTLEIPYLASHIPAWSISFPWTKLGMTL